MPAVFRACEIQHGSLMVMVKAALGENKSHCTDTDMFSVSSTKELHFRAWGRLDDFFISNIIHCDITGICVGWNKFSISISHHLWLSSWTSRLVAVCMWGGWNVHDWAIARGYLDFMSGDDCFFISVNFRAFSIPKLWEWNNSSCLLGYHWTATRRWQWDSCSSQAQNQIIEWLNAVCGQWFYVYMRVLHVIRRQQTLFFSKAV